MSDKKQSPGDTIANHIAGLETKLHSEKIVVESLTQELHARAVELVNLGAENRSRQIVNGQLVETVTNLRTEMEGMRKNFMETGLLIQEQHNQTRTELERSERELQAERDKPVGSDKFILQLVTLTAAQTLYDYFNMRVVHAAFTRKGLSRLQADVLNHNTQPTARDELSAPVSLQEIVKVYCATTRTAFDTESLLSDVSNYIEQNRDEILELDAAGAFRSLRQDIAEDANSERRIKQVVETASCPELISDLFRLTTGEYLFAKEQHDEALIVAVREATVSFIEEISFEIPISLE